MRRLTGPWSSGKCKRIIRGALIRPLSGHSCTRCRLWRTLALLYQYASDGWLALLNPRHIARIAVQSSVCCATWPMLLLLLQDLVVRAILVTASGVIRMLRGAKVVSSTGLHCTAHHFSPTPPHCSYGVHFPALEPANLGASFQFASSYCPSQSGFKIPTDLSTADQAVRTLKPDLESAQRGMLPAIGVRFPFPCTLVSGLLV